MARNLISGYCHCPTVERTISAHQTEGECRDQNRCGAEPCPFAGEFLTSNATRQLPDFITGAWSWWFTPGTRRGR